MNFAPTKETMKLVHMRLTVLSFDLSFFSVDLYIAPFIYFKSNKNEFDDHITIGYSPISLLLLRLPQV